MSITLAAGVLRSGTRIATSAVIAVTATLLALAPSAAARADEPFPVTWDGDSTLSIEYGEDWYLTITAGQPASYQSQGITWRALDSAGGAYSDLFIYMGGGSISSGNAPAPLTAGTHELTAEVTSEYYGTARSPAKAVVSVAPAAMGVDLRVVADPASRTGAILSANLTGAFVDRLLPGDYEGSPRALIPAGSWTLTVADAAGETAFTQTIDTQAGVETGVSAYWPGADPDSDFSATATFTPVASTAANFDISASRPFPYTSPAAAVTDAPAPTTKPAPAPAPTALTGPMLPVWALGASGLLAFLCVIGITVIAVMQHRRNGAERADDATDESKGAIDAHA